MVLPNLTIVCSWDTLWVSPSTSMQVAMVMASQFVMMYVYMVACGVYFSHWHEFADSEFEIGWEESREME